MIPLPYTEGNPMKQLEEEPSSCPFSYLSVSAVICTTSPTLAILQALAFFFKNLQPLPLFSAVPQETRDRALHLHYTEFITVTCDNHLHVALFMLLWQCTGTSAIKRSIVYICFGTVHDLQGIIKETKDNSSWILFPDVLLCLCDLGSADSIFKFPCICLFLIVALMLFNWWGQ